MTILFLVPSIRVLSSDGFLPEATTTQILIESFLQHKNGKKSRKQKVNCLQAIGKSLARQLKQA